MSARTAQEIWEAALGELQIQVNRANYKTWLEKTVGLNHQNGQFVVGVPNVFVAEYLDKNQRSLVEKTLIGLTNHSTQVVFRVDAKSKNSPGSNGTREGISAFNRKYTFDSFIVGNCNRLAHAAALEVAKNPGHSYNPLFIYGGAGLGKTHLLQAIGHMALASNIRVIYVSGERFTNEFVNAIRDKKTKEFRNKYRNVDMLLVDDIQFIKGKEQTEETFFHTFNELHNANHQIALTSDTPPKSMPLLKERLRSRFEWGLVADIQPPDFETRLAILHAIVERRGATIAADVLEFIAQQIQQNIRQLEGSLNRVVALAKLTSASPTPELAAQALKDIGSKVPKSTSITPDHIIEAAASNFQLTPSDLKSRKRDKNTALARRVAMYLIRQETNCSLTQIGKALGGRDHSTISNACEKIASDIDASPYLRHKILDIQQEIHPKT